MSADNKPLLPLLGLSVLVALGLGAYLLMGRSAPSDPASRAGASEQREEVGDDGEGARRDGYDDRRSEGERAPAGRREDAGGLPLQANPVRRALGDEAPALTRDEQLERLVQKLPGFHARLEAILGPPPGSNEAPRTMPSSPEERRAALFLIDTTRKVAENPREALRELRTAPPELRAALPEEFGALTVHAMAEAGHPAVWNEAMRFVARYPDSSYSPEMKRIIDRREGASPNGPRPPELPRP